MRIYVTGAHGFVGKNFIQRFKDKITIVDYKLEEFNKKNIFLPNVFHNSKMTAEVGKKIDVIVHLAAKTSIPNSLTNPYDTYYSNLLGTLKILDFARINKISNIVNVSTYVYGNPQYIPIDEMHPIRPHSPYNKSKFLSEHLCRCYSEDFKLNIVTLRPFYIYGPMGNSNSFIPSVIKQLIDGNREREREKGKEGVIVNISNRNTKRDFLYVDDFSDLLFKIIQVFPDGYNIFNVGYGKSHSLEDIVLTIEKLTGIRVKIQDDDTTRPNDILNMTADITKVFTTFNWKPTTDLTTGLKKILKTYNLMKT